MSPANESRHPASREQWASGKISERDRKAFFWMSIIASAVIGVFAWLITGSFLGFCAFAGNATVFILQALQGHDEEERVAVLKQRVISQADEIIRLRALAGEQLRKA